MDVGFGLRRIIDSRLRFLRDSGPVFLRLRNFQTTETEPWSQLGFVIAPSGTPLTGTTDIPIDPPPSTSMISMHNIGQSMGKLRLGARTVRVSHTFVLAQVEAQALTDPTLVWRGPNVVGLVIDAQLFEIATYEYKDLSGAPVIWDISVNAPEQITIQQ